MYDLGKKCLFSETAFCEHLILLNLQNIYIVTISSQILKAAIIIFKIGYEFSLPEELLFFTLYFCTEIN